MQRALGPRMGHIHNPLHHQTPPSPAKKGIHCNLGPGRFNPLNRALFIYKMYITQLCQIGGLCAHGVMVACTALARQPAALAVPQLGFHALLLGLRVRISISCSTTS